MRIRNISGYFGPEGGNIFNLFFILIIACIIIQKYWQKINWAYGRIFSLTKYLPFYGLKYSILNANRFKISLFHKQYFSLTQINLTPE